MKKIISAIFAMLIVSIFSFYTVAQENTLQGKLQLNSNVAKIINSQLSDEDIAILNKQEIYNSSMQGEYISKPIFKIYNSSACWDWADESLQTIIEKAEKYRKITTNKEFLILDDIPRKIVYINNSKDIELLGVRKTYSENVPEFIMDFYDLKSNININGSAHMLKEIYCFDNEPSPLGIVVFLKTETEVFIKVYDNSRSQAEVYTQSEFAKYGIDFYNYISSPENNYDENGNPLGGKRVSFNDFVKYGAPPIHNTVTVPQNNSVLNHNDLSENVKNDGSNNESKENVIVANDKSDYWLWGGIAVAACTVAVGAVCCVALIRRKKRKCDIH